MKTTAAKPAVAYIRVSTAAQAEEGVSLEAQRERCAAWAIAHGRELAAVHVDAGLSGSRSDNRPGLAAALADAESLGGVLVVYSLSRLARSTADTIAIAERLEASGSDLVSLTESIDTTTAAGKMVFRMLAVLAEFERDLVSERTRAALASKAARGERISGRIPFGFALAADGVHLEPVKREQAIIARILALRASGLSFRAIADALDADAMPARNGGRWSPKVLRDVVRRNQAA